MLFVYVFVLAVVLAGLYCRYGRAGRLAARLPSMGHKQPWPIIGNVLELLTSPEELYNTLRRCYQEHGGINKICGVFNIRYVNIYDPEDIEKILSSPKFNEKQDPYNFLSNWLGEGLLVSNGAKWFARRKILTPAFHFSILREFTKTFVEQGAALGGELRAAAGTDIDIRELVARATLRVMCETSMGTTMDEGVESVTKKYFKAIHVLGESIVYRVSRVWLHYSWMFALTRVARTQRKILADLHGFTEHIIKERRAYRQQVAQDPDEKTTRPAMLDLLLESQQRGLIDDLGIREEVDTFMFEGHDTTAMALTYLLMSLAYEPEVQERVYQELVSVTGGTRDPTGTELRELKYLEACIKETLRLYPSVPYIARYLTQDVELSGYTVPAGCVLNVHILDLHRRADIYPDPERFLPERFLPPLPPRHPYAYIPFSAGPRNCIGQKFAMLELLSAAAGVVRRVKLSRPDCIAPDAAAPRFVVDLVLRSCTPVVVHVTPRDEDTSAKCERSLNCVEPTVMCE